MSEYIDIIKSKKIIEVIVKPNSPKSEIMDYDNNKKIFKINLHAKPKDGDANQELLKLLKKKYKLNFEIISGKTSRKKLLKKR